jgi:hypothetical protein
MAIRQVTRAGVGLVIGIIILALLAFGGLYIVNQRGEQARREEVINIADQQLQAESDQEVAIDTTEATPAEESSAPAGDNSGNTAAAPTANPASELPQTGPEAASIAMLGVLAFAAASFAHSRKQLSDR